MLRAGEVKCKSRTMLAIAVSASASLGRVVLSVDVGTESTRAALFDRDGKKLGSAAAAHATTHPNPAWAEQSAEDWWAGLGEAVRGALAEAGCASGDVAAMCMATTSCTVMACKADGTPLRPALLWMDARSAEQAAEIMHKGKGDPALDVNCGGEGPLSAEWMLCKALWIKQREPETWEAADVICECQDWLQFKCTGELVAGGCNVATRWHCDGVAAVAGDEGDGFAGRPLGLLSKVGLDDLPAKWPRRCVAMGALQGRLTAEAAAHLGLVEGTPVAQGGADAFVGLVGLGAASGAVGLITGSSHLHLAIVEAARRRHAPGAWGAYAGAPLSYQAMAEGGQSSTGAALQWARRLFGSGGGDDGVSLRTLDEEAAALPLGAEGLSALETFQGSRTPVTDALARGALVGLTLKHTRAHVWRAMLEAVCLGTRAAVDGLAAATGGEAPRVLLAAGGATRSPLWLQMHADATGLPVVVGAVPDAPLLGGAVLAAALPGSLHGDDGDGDGDGGDGGSASPRVAIERATAAMVRESVRVEPDATRAAQFSRLYRLRYAHLAPTLAPLSHRSTIPIEGTSSSSSPSLAAAASAAAVAAAASTAEPRMPRSGRAVLVEPSLLAADVGNLAAAAREAAAAGASWVHVDITDGSRPAGGALSSLGPASVAAVRAAVPSLRIDVHLYTLHPEAHVAAVAAAGADRVTFQIETMGDDDGEGWDTPEAAARAMALVAQIRAAGCGVGVCIAPGTPATAVTALVASGAVELVDVLAVNPGIGGQPFRHEQLAKVRELRAAHPQLPYLMVDGGIDAATAPLAAAAGANALVSGSYVFGAPLGGLAERLEALHLALVERGE